MQHDYRAVVWRGKWAVEWYEGGARRRHSLGTTDRNQVSRLAAEFAAQRETAARPATITVRVAWEAYRESLGDRSTAETLRYLWTAIGPAFADLPANAVADDEVEAYMRARRRAGKKEWTIWTEIQRLQSALAWAAKKGLIDKAPALPRPPEPPPRDVRMTKEQARDFLAACGHRHVALFCRLAIATGGRMEAILDLTWDRVDFTRRQINLRDPERQRTSKGRALVAMNDSIFDALASAATSRSCDFVIEYGGERILSIKKGIQAAARRAGMPWVTAHIFRHSAATWMAEAGVSMDEIAQFLGHTNPKITFKVYARFSPTFMRRAASAVEFET